MIALEIRLRTCPYALLECRVPLLCSSCFTIRSFRNLIRAQGIYIVGREYLSLSMQPSFSLFLYFFRPFSSLFSFLGDNTVAKCILAAVLALHRRHSDRERVPTVVDKCVLTSILSRCANSNEGKNKSRELFDDVRYFVSLSISIASRCRIWHRKKKYTETSMRGSSGIASFFLSFCVFGGHIKGIRGGSFIPAVRRISFAAANKDAWRHA